MEGKMENPSRRTWVLMAAMVTKAGQPLAVGSHERCLRRGGVGSKENFWKLCGKAEVRIGRQRQHWRTTPVLPHPVCPCYVLRPL